jgi:MSHA biogenesis protein MshJ
MMDKLKNIQVKIDSLSLRERAVIFIGILAVLFSVWDAVLMAPMSKQQKKMVSDLNSKNTERLVLSTRMQGLVKQSQEDPNKANLGRLKSLRSQLVNIQAGLEVSTQNLVSPKEMPKLLESVLHKTGGLTLLSLKSLGAKPLIVKAEEGDEKASQTVKATNKNLNADNIDNAYKHGIRIEFKGDYFTTMEYLESLEQLEWGFFWDNFEFSVTDYPEAKAAIEIFTLSLREEWIGV